MPRGVGRRDRGFALILVLWTLVLVSFIATHLVATGRTELKIATNLAANAVVGAAADAAVNQAIFQLLDPRPEGGWPLDGVAREIAIAGCRVALALRDESARINPNLATPALIEALLRVTGGEAANARLLAAAIEEWVTPAVAGGVAGPRRADAAAERYRAAGLDYAPPGEPIETLDELQRVLGMTPAVFAAIKPHLSLFAPAQPMLTGADPVVMAAAMQAGIAPPGPGARQLGAVTARIEALAQGPGGARAGRGVVVRIVPQSRSFAVLEWRGDGG